jgi:hypothetical protein
MTAFRTAITAPKIFLKVVIIKGYSPRAGFLILLFSSHLRLLNP